MSKFVLQPEDGSVDFGNTRGDDSVDLQVVRNNATEVASGYASFLIGGKANTASGTYSAALVQITSLVVRVLLLSVKITERLGTIH
jgi:hypothetical protein